MSIELIIFIAMVGTFMVGCFAAKLPVSVAMLAASVVGALVGGQGVPLRHLVEGTFSYIDTILTIATAMVFMKVVEKSGALDALSSLIIEKFHKVPALLLILIMLVIMFPGMITGSSTASVLSAGSMQHHPLRKQQSYAVRYREMVQRCQGLRLHQPCRRREGRVRPLFVDQWRRIPYAGSGVDGGIRRAERTEGAVRREGDQGRSDTVTS